MARGVNKVILVGRLGHDPDCRELNAGKVANISLATTSGWKDKNTGENRESTEWHKVVIFGRLADIVQQYLHQGSQVYIEGRLQTDKWTDKNGVERYTTKIICSDMQMLGDANANTNVNDRKRYARTPPTQANTQANSSSTRLDDVPF